MAKKSEDRQGCLIAAVVGLHHKVDKKILTEGVTTKYDLEISGKIGQLAVDADLRGAFTLTPSMTTNKTVKFSAKQLLALLLKQSSKRAAGLMRTIIQEAADDRKITYRLTEAEFKEASTLIDLLDLKQSSYRSGAIKEVNG